MTRRPLPRSLVPLEDESMVGFLLRLAHYTGSTPAAIAARMGLADRRGINIPAGSLLALSPARLEEAAHVARLSPAEMENLLLAPLGERYGPLNQQYEPWYGPQLLTYPRRWVHLRSTQFCQRCLARDKSPLGLLLGGPWKRRWHLPVVFACVEHRRLLKQHCPHCGHPAHAARVGLLGRAAQDGLHPAQCRASPPGHVSRKGSPVCGGYLTDRAPERGISRDPVTRETIVDLQRRIDAHLLLNGTDSAASCGSFVPVAQYFMDLRAVTALIFVSWPQARSLAATELLARAIDWDAEPRHRNVRDLKRRAGRAPANEYFLAPPATALATGAVLGVAERLLAGARGSGERAELVTMYERAIDVHPRLSLKLARGPGTSAALSRALGLTSPATGGSGLPLTSAAEAG